MSPAAQRIYCFMSLVVLELHVVCVAKSNVVELVKYRSKTRVIYTEKPLPMYN
jgi:hypothetical protein